MSFTGVAVTILPISTENRSCCPRLEARVQRCQTEWCAEKQVMPAAGIQPQVDPKIMSLEIFSGSGSGDQLCMFKCQESFLWGRPCYAISRQRRRQLASKTCLCFLPRDVLYHSHTFTQYHIYLFSPLAPLMLHCSLIALTYPVTNCKD